MRSGASLEDRQRWMRERNAPLGPIELAPDTARPYEEKHYTPAELGALWGLSVEAVRKLFLDEPGVLVLGGYAPTKGKRTYFRDEES